MAGSEIAQLRERIAQEYQAARLALFGLSSGVARHDFIEAKMDRVGEYQEQLADLVGRERATAIVVETFDACPVSLLLPDSKMTSQHEEGSDDA